MNNQHYKEVTEVSKNNEQFFRRNELADHLGGNPKPIYRRLWARGIPADQGERVWRIAEKDIERLGRSLGG
jgi:hypothetical protein